MSFFSNMKFTPEKYKEASVLAREVGEEMIARLEWMTLKPRVIVDLGCGTGDLSARLQAHYKEAQVIGIDLSEAMINHARQNNTQLSCVCANAASLPFADQSVDLLFANLMFPWVQDISSLLKECHRVLRTDGLLMFSALGPDTFKEWQNVFESGDLPFLIDMHDAGDLLLKHNLADPILDVNYYTLSYRDQSQLLDELLITGMLSKLPDESANNTLEVTYEVVIAHAFAGELKQTSEDGITRIPLSHLRKQLRS